MDKVEQLFRAVAEGDASGVASIVGAEPPLARASNADRLSVLQFARFMERPDILDQLIAAGPPLDIFDAASLDIDHRVRELLGGEASLAIAFSDDGFTALHFAAYYGATESVRVLLEQGASTEAVTKNFLANMPLHAAAAGGHLSIMAMLLDHGADVNAKQHGGFVVLHTAAQHGSKPMVELLLKHGADPALTTDEGETPAHRARSQGISTISTLLGAKTPAG